MLKALELSGFKSFAERTRFEFPRGISVVVGPNGSGKSNLVDAVKWVLGSQSAKSLRGKEMVDVVFNGSATRGPAGTAEATLTLDNSTGALPIDAREVQVTRRVYRSGEGEYLINRQPCRLRDIRDLLAGTGITTEAYCIIEQGKVDALLQSSPRDRRVIFEEAAGISQFKAKKALADRRLERVDQNLLRLSDIVDEVESRLRSVRMQAGKARRYRECAARLQQLRTEVALVDWRKLTTQISARDQQMAALGSRQEQQEASLAHLEMQVQELERELESAVQAVREIEAAASATRERIAALEATLENQRTRRADLEHDSARLRRQLTAMGTRADDATDQLRDAAAQLQAAEEELARNASQLHERQATVAVSQRELDEARAAWEHGRNRQAETTRQLTSLGKQVTELVSQLAATHAARDQLEKRLAELDRHRETRATELVRQEEAERELTVESESRQAALRSREQRLAQARRELAHAEKQLRHVESQLARNRERITVLTELDERLDGPDSGPGQVLRMAREAPDGPLADVRGVVADLFHVDVDSAPLVELALGERARYIVAAGAERLLDWLEREAPALASRVGFLRLDTRNTATALDQVDLSTEPGVMGRADRFVEAAADCVPLVRRLLGRTWFVDRLATAVKLSQTTGRGLDFITSDGEALAADGTLVVGPRLATSGLLSRRSQLRACHDQVAELEPQRAQREAQVARWQEALQREEAAVAADSAKHTELRAQLVVCRQQTIAARGQLEQVSQDHQRIRGELQAAIEQTAAGQAELQSTQRARAEAEQAVDQLNCDIEAASGKLTQATAGLERLKAAATEQQIVVAKCEERVEMLRHRQTQAERDRQERDRALADVRDRLNRRQTEAAELDQAVLAANQALAELFLQKERQAEQLVELAAADKACRQQRANCHEQIRTERQQLATLQSQWHKLEIAVSKLRHERQSLCERMHDDYGIDLETAGNREGEAPAEPGSAGASPSIGADASAISPASRDAVEREIAELRNQLNTIGAVNLDALEELDELEARFGKLSGQYRDLVDAKLSLERIIHRINIDSRQLFMATLETVRGHFQELFRQLFGGGEADIVPDENEDVLECGIEIVARPPGKEACSISLLSGGEKTLTCVALLLAVFRSKPSPFCVLDEVDAALDEANIGRFIVVLREFLSFTQFVVVSHSKKTMAAADTLYGITMEESGVSKRVAVRMDDTGASEAAQPTRRAA